MTRKSDSPRVPFVRGAMRGLAAATLVVIGLCATVAGQDVAPALPDLLPLDSTPPPKPLKDVPAAFKGDLQTKTGSFDFFMGTSFGRIGKAPKDDKTQEPATDPLSQARSTLQEKQDALAHWDKEIQAHPKEARCYFERGRLRLDEGKEEDRAVLDAAIADLSRALELDPEHVEARFLRGYAASQKEDMDAALADLSRVIEHHPDHALALIERARVFLGREEFDKALADLDRAAASRPGENESEMLLCRARCLAGKGDYPRAIAELTAVMEKFPVEPGTLEERAIYYHNRGDLDRALADIDEFLRFRPNDPSGEFFRVSFLAEAGRYIVAFREADRLRAVQPDNPLPYFLRFLPAWMAACQRDRWLAHAERIATRIEPLLPSSIVTHLARIGSARLTGIGRGGAMADLDHCIDRVPCLSFPYGVGAIFNAYEGRFIPTCRDLAIFLIRFDWKNYQLSASIDWDRPRLKFSFHERCPHEEAQGKPEDPVAEIGGKCMDMGFQQLLAAAFHSTQ